MMLLALSTIGGAISMASTSLGAVLASVVEKYQAQNNRWSLSLDFALGMMVSAAAFSLIAPAAQEAQQSTQLSLMSVALAPFAGGALVLMMKLLINQYQTEIGSEKNHFLLVSILMLHNFPEGLASGSALSGLVFSHALPLLGAISIQNIPEGALMVICLRAMGWSPREALVGGILSGAVELFGGLLAGILSHFIMNVLPVVMSFAGGAMMISVIVELCENKKPWLSRVFSQAFVLGFLLLPLFQFVVDE